MSFLRKADEKPVDVTPMRTMMSHFQEEFSMAKGHMTDYGVYQLELSAPKDATQRKSFIMELNSALCDTFPASSSGGEISVSINIHTNSTLIQASGNLAPKFDALMTALDLKKDNLQP